MSEYFHASLEKALAGDVYGIRPESNRLERRQLRIALIGCGGVAQSKWLPALTRLRTLWEPVELVAIVEPDEEQGRKIERIYGCRRYRNAQSMLSENELDGVLVLCPDDFHLENARDCLAHGLHVLVEKPLANSLQGAAELCELAEDQGRILMTVANKRFSPPYRVAQHLISTGRLGELSMFTGKFNLGYDYVQLLEGGTIHLFDLAIFLMGPVTQVSATAVKRYSTVNPKYPLDNVAILLKFASGAIGSLTSSSSALSFKPWERVEVYGHKSWLSVEDQYQLTLHEGEAEPSQSWRPAPANTLLFDEEFGGYSALLENFLQSIRGEEQPWSTGWDGFHALELLRAVQLSIIDNDWISLPLDPTRADRRVAEQLAQAISTTASGGHEHA